MHTILKTLHLSKYLIFIFKILYTYIYNNIQYFRFLMYNIYGNYHIFDKYLLIFNSYQLCHRILRNFTCANRIVTKKSRLLTENGNYRLYCLQVTTVYDVISVITGVAVICY